MKTQKMTRSHTRQLILSTLAVLALSTLAGAGSAEAGVKFGVKLNTPVVTAAYHSGNHGSGLHVRIPAHRCQVKITKFDRKVARKLAQRTVYSKGELLRLKRAGYNWNEVGRMLRLPKRMVRNVVKDVRISMHQGGRRGNQDFGYYDGDDWDDRDDRRGRNEKPRGWCGTR